MDDQYALPNWVVSPSTLHEFLNDVLTLDDVIMEVMALEDRPSENMHHHAYFIPDHERVEKVMQTLVFSNIVNQYPTPIMTHDALSEGNLGNI